MDAKLVQIELRVEWLVVAERHVGKREIEGIRGQHRRLETLRANVGIRVNGLGQARSKIIKLDAGNRRPFLHRRRHEADEVPQSARRLQDLPMLKPEPFQRRVHSTDHDRGRIVRIEGGGAR